MGFFESLGQRTERIKQTLTGGSDYECFSCKETLSNDYETCPHCGSEEILSVE